MTGGVWDAVFLPSLSLNGLSSSEIRTYRINAMERPENHPEPNRTVLTRWKYKDGGNEIISVGEFNGEEWNAQAIIYPEIFEMIGWREIHK